LKVDVCLPVQGQEILPETSFLKGKLNGKMEITNGALAWENPPLFTLSIQIVPFYCCGEGLLVEFLYVSENAPI